MVFFASLIITFNQMNHNKSGETKNSSKALLFRTPGEIYNYLLCINKLFTPE